MMEIRRVLVAGVPVDTVDQESASERVRKALSGNAPGGAVVAINPRKVMSARGDFELQEFFSNACLLLPDGVGVVWAVKRLYGMRVARTAGIDMMAEICRVAQEERSRVFVFGAEEEVNRIAVDKMKSLYRSIDIVGRSNGYVSDETTRRLIEEINEKKVDILFVALGSPAQERWMIKHLSGLPTVKICQGLGGTLDVLSGRYSRAPSWLRRVGAEWLYRTLCNPRQVSRLPILARFMLTVLRLERSTCSQRKG